MRRPTHSYGQAQKDNPLLLTLREEPRLTTLMSSLYCRSWMWKENLSLMWMSHEKGKTVDLLIRPMSHCFVMSAFFFEI
jgi:hypothetical protein